MRYWVYSGDKLIGPCERDELPEVAGFDANTLVCLEEQAGAFPQQWQWRRAVQVQDLALYLLPAKKAGVPAADWGRLLPPEPTLGDASEMNSLQEKLLLLSNAVQGLRDRLAEQDARIAELKSAVSEKEKALEVALRSIYEAEAQGARIAELKGEIAGLRAEIAKIGEGRPAQPPPPL